jgi:CheY-like chemotaxis protein
MKPKERPPVWAADGIEAIQALEHRPCDAMLRDGKMQEMDWRQAAASSASSGSRAQRIGSHHRRGMRPKALLTKLIEEAASPEAKH